MVSDLLSPEAFDSLRAILNFPGDRGSICSGSVRLPGASGAEA